MVPIWRYAAIVNRLEIAANLVRRIVGDDVVLRKVAILDGIVVRARVGAFAAFRILVTGWLISAVTAGALIAIAGFLIVLAFMVAAVAALTATVTLMVAAVATTTLATVAPAISTAISAAALAATVTTTVSAISTTIAIAFGIGGAESEVRQVAVSRKMPGRQD